MKSQLTKPQCAFTLMELVIVMTIFVVLGGLVLFELTGFGEKASHEATVTTLDAVRDAINGTSPSQNGHGYRQDMGSFAATQPTKSLPSTLANLYAAPAGAPSYIPITRLGWRGPYLNGDAGVYAVNINKGFTTDYSVAGTPTPVDAWNHPIVIQVPASDPTYARLVSAGPDGVIDTPPNYLDANGKPYPPQSMRGDDIVLFLLRPDVPSTP